MLKQGGGIGDMIYADLTGTCDGNKNGKLAELADYKAGDPSQGPYVYGGSTEINNAENLSASFLTSVCLKPPMAGH
jgi:hypothetical protein